MLNTCRDNQIRKRATSGTIQTWLCCDNRFQNYFTCNAVVSVLLFIVFIYVYLEEFEELFPKPDDDELEIMVATAYHYAQRHFDHKIAINVTLGIYYNGVADFAYFPSETLTFVAADDEGRVIEISIQRESK